MFVTLEGPEGAGKSTVLKALVERLRAKGREVVATREPGSGEVGGAVREILLHGEELHPLTELFLFLADRAEHVAKTVRPALEHGKVVLCDRFADSTVAYQGFARGLGPDLVRSLNATATGGLVPDLTLLLDIDPEHGLARAKGGDRLDHESLAFHQKVRDGYSAEARRDPDRWRTVDASLPLDQVVALCWAEVDARLPMR